MLRETQATHDELLARAAAVGPFFSDTATRVAVAVRNRSLAFLEGAVAEMPKQPITGSIATVQAMSEAEVMHAITAGLAPPA